MGIRVQKVIGYGLTDVKTEKGAGWRIADERINGDSPGLQAEAPAIEDYRSWLETRRKEGDIETDIELSLLREPEPNELRLHLDDAITHEGEFGLPNVLVISPPTFRGWSRYDDPIDYIEESYLRHPPNKPQQNWVKKLRHGIYPFIGYMDANTGEKLDDKVFYWIRATSNHPRPSDQDLDLIAQAAGFEDNQDAWERVAPVVPNDIRNLATFLDLFTDPETWLQLRPVLYTHWS